MSEPMLRLVCQWPLQGRTTTGHHVVWISSMHGSTQIVIRCSGRPKLRDSRPRCNATFQQGKSVVRRGEYSGHFCSKGGPVNSASMTTSTSSLTPMVVPGAGMPYAIPNSERFSVPVPRNRCAHWDPWVARVAAIEPGFEHDRPCDTMQREVAIDAHRVLTRHSNLPGFELHPRELRDVQPLIALQFRVEVQLGGIGIVRFQ